MYRQAKVLIQPIYRNTIQSPNVNVEPQRGHPHRQPTGIKNDRKWWDSDSERSQQGQDSKRIFYYQNTLGLSGGPPVDSLWQVSYDTYPIDISFCGGVLLGVFILCLGVCELGVENCTFLCCVPSAGSATSSAHCNFSIDFLALALLSLRSTWLGWASVCLSGDFLPVFVWLTDVSETVLFWWPTKLTLLAVKLVDLLIGGSTCLLFWLVNVCEAGLVVTGLCLEITEKLEVLVIFAPERTTGLLISGLAASSSLVRVKLDRLTWLTRGAMGNFLSSPATLFTCGRLMFGLADNSAWLSVKLDLLSLLEDATCAVLFSLTVTWYVFLGTAELVDLLKPAATCRGDCLLVPWLVPFWFASEALLFKAEKLVVLLTVGTVCLESILALTSIGGFLLVSATRPTFWPAETDIVLLRGFTVKLADRLIAIDRHSWSFCVWTFRLDEEVVNVDLFLAVGTMVVRWLLTAESGVGLEVGIVDFGVSPVCGVHFGVTPVCGVALKVFWRRRVDPDLTTAFLLQWNTNEISWYNTYILL